MSSRARARSEGATHGRLTPQHNGIARDQVAEIQRARILAGMVEVSAERGAANVTVAHVVARSGVSRRTFYELFVDREDCFLAAFDDAIQRIAAVVLPAYEGPSRWLEKVRAGLTALLQFLDQEPGVGRFAIVETLAAGPGAFERRRRVLAQTVAAVDEGRVEAKRSEGLLPMTAEGVVGGVLSVLHSRLLDPDGDTLLELTGSLTSMIVLPYLGGAAARGELQRPVPERCASPRAASPDPLRDLEMRLTYRTVRVLMAVAERPGSSNRQIGVASGMQDQGQISKLLTRLHKLGLIENSPAGLARGTPNSWMLTNKGTEIQQAVGRAG